MASNIIELVSVSKKYRDGRIALTALDDINLTIQAGEFVAISGPSGSGKSTLMNIVGLLDTPTQGQLIIDNQKITPKSKINQLARLRREEIGFIFQTFNLLSRASARQNVVLPMIYSRRKNPVAMANKILASVGLLSRAQHHPNELSGGERQRVAIARALSNNPKIILADEPTGNLDSKSGQLVLNILKKMNRQGKTLIIVTHDENIAKQAGRIIKLKDGKVVK